MDEQADFVVDAQTEISTPICDDPISQCNEIYATWGDDRAIR